MSDDKLRAIYNARVAGTAPANRADCPTPEQLQLLSERANGDSASNLAMLDHVFGCAYCRAEFAILRTVQSEPDAAKASSAAQSKAASRWLTGPRIAIAAGLLLAVGIAGESLRRMRLNDSSDVVRNAGGDASDVVLVAPLANAAGAQFVWRRVTEAVTYEVQVLDTVGGVLATHVTSDTVYTPSDAERAKLELAGRIDWYVAARRADGNERRSNIVRARFGATERR